MGRRPQTNRRRGLLRAAAAVIGLIILLIIIVTVVSSLTAPTVKAPTIPPTAGPISTPPTTGTPTTRAGTPVTPSSPKPAPSPTAKSKHKRVALGPIVLNDRTSHLDFHVFARQTGRMISPSVDRRSGAIAYFARAGSASDHVSLLLRRGGTVERIGYGDRFVRPVWSSGGRHLLYVHVAATSGIPGAVWTLMEWTRRDGSNRAVARVSALALTPLGWRLGSVVYLIAQPTTSTIYAERGGRSTRLGTVLAQPLVHMSLSPNGRYLAFGAPANCGPCTLDVYDLGARKVWIGPTGMADGAAVAWTPGNLLVADMRGRLAVVNPGRQLVTYTSLPPHLPSRWPNIMRAEITPQQVSLVDSVTGRSYVSYGAGR